jgi:DNA-binding IclR family transcriptional regulator
MFHTYIFTLQLVSVQRPQYTAANRTTVQLVGLSVFRGNTARYAEREVKGAVVALVGQHAVGLGTEEDLLWQDCGHLFISFCSR